MPLSKKPGSLFKIMLQVAIKFAFAMGEVLNRSAGPCGAAPHEPGKREDLLLRIPDRPRTVVHAPPGE
jgi:hypothetical protein